MKKIIPIPREIADPSRAREDECAGLRARVAAQEQQTFRTEEKLNEFAARNAELLQRVASLEEGLRTTAEYLDALEANMLRNDVDMMMDKCNAPSFVAEDLRALLSPGKDAHG